MPPEYVRCIYWLAHLHGMGMNQTWYWSRNDDGSPKTKSKSGFYASNLTKPRVLNAFGRTMKELNAFALEVVALARQPKHIRLFYSETSAIQDATYLDHVHKSYKELYHGGTPLGFVTGNILTKAAPSELRSWPVVVVTNANYVTAAERKALSRYMSQGGTLVIAGPESLKRDEYGRAHAEAMVPARAGRILCVGPEKKATAFVLVAGALQRAGVTPPVSLRESNAVGQPGCVWRTAPWKGGTILLIVNLGKGLAEIDTASKRPCRDMVANAQHPAKFNIKPFEVKLLYLHAPSP